MIAGSALAPGSAQGRAVPGGIAVEEWGTWLRKRNIWKV